MKEFKFEIQNCITVNIKANSKEEARNELINKLEDYGDQMVDGTCYVSDGIEVQKQGK